MWVVDLSCLLRLPVSSVQFITASRPSTECFIRTTGTGSDGRSCHFSHCPHKLLDFSCHKISLHSKHFTRCEQHTNIQWKQKWRFFTAQPHSPSFRVNHSIEKNVLSSFATSLFNFPIFHFPVTASRPTNSHVPPTTTTVRSHLTQADKVQLFRRHKAEQCHQLLAPAQRSAVTQAPLLPLTSHQLLLSQNAAYSARQL